MKISLFTLLSIILILGCKEKSKQSFYDIINDNFLKIVDTNSYKTGRLIQIPNDTSKHISSNKICIWVDTIIYNSLEFNKYLLKFFQEKRLKDFEELLTKGSNIKLETLDILHLTKVGKYVLRKSKVTNDAICTTTVGKVTFYEPYITLNKAIIIFSISESSKSGFTSCLLFRKENGVWENIKKIEIERW